MPRRALALCGLLATCSGEEPGSAWFLTEAADLRDGFMRWCPAVTAARETPAVARSGSLLAAAEDELETGWVSGPAFLRFMEGPKDSEETLVRTRETLAALELTTQCDVYVAELEALVEAARIGALPGAPEYAGRGFVLVDEPAWLRPWKDGDHARAWAGGGVAVTVPRRSSVKRPWFMSVVPVAGMPGDCVAAGRAYLESRSLPMGTVDPRDEERELARAPGSPSCMFVARPEEPHRGVVGMFLALEFGTFRVVCEGDDRSREDREDCSRIVRAQLRPAGAGSYRSALDHWLWVPEWGQ